MEEKFDYTYALRSSIDEEIYLNSEKNTENENNKSDEQKSINTHVNNMNISKSNISNVNNLNIKSNCNENIYYNSYIQYNNDKHIGYNIFQNDHADLIKYYNKNLSSNEPIGLGDFIQSNCKNYIEQDINKKTSNTSYNTANLNGKQIITNNEAMSNALNDMYNNNTINLENKVDMQFLKKKKPRRKKEEVDKEKREKSNKIKIKKKLGRKPINDIGISIHTKKSDDNIMKKINSYFLESVRNWINKSYIDSDRKFIPLRTIKKYEKELLKIDPKLIATNLKRKNIMAIMDKKIKDIFSNAPSSKYKKYENNKNIELINEIYEQNQPFIIFITDSTFIQIFNIFNGQTTEEELKIYLMEKLNSDEYTINQFINNFDKFKNFAQKIRKKLEGKESEEKTKDYIERILILCLNYRKWFSDKFDRRENKKKKLIKEEKKDDV